MIEAQTLAEAAIAEIKDAPDVGALERIRLDYLGRGSGRISALLESIGNLPQEQRPGAGKAANEAKRAVESALEARAAELERGRLADLAEVESIDVTFPAPPLAVGRIHVLTQVQRELEEILAGIGFSVEVGPEVETDWYNFEALNFTPDHPARDTQDTFFVDVDQLLLRTHTSNAQIRSMEKWKPPVRVLSAGRVYRRDEITMRKSPMFHQAEGLLVDKGIHIGHLRATLQHFIRKLFGEELRMRMRPSYFPFTEPSAEVDMSCVFCKGAGCSTCSQTGWMEILGCGMIHPQVLRNVGFDPDEWSGFAFGMGLDRVAMIKFDIPNIRTLFENDLRVLQQF